MVKIINNNYDLIILNIMLPNLDGYEILKKIRKENVDSKIIMLTARSTLEDKLNGLQNGANDYVTKPFHKITITLEDDSENTLSDSSNSSYDGCIFSNAELEFNGTGSLTINGNQTTSEGIVIEGKNSVSLENSTLIDTNSELNGKSTTYKNIFLYQSMNGDASDGVSNFTASNSTITTNKRDTFYITNTSAIINFVNNKITNNDSTGSFLRAQSDAWGEVTEVMEPMSL